MAFDIRNFSFSRMGLPALAVIGLALAVFYIVRDLPDRRLEEPEREPPRATGALADTDRVVGAGVVEPSSETIQIGTALSGLVMDLRVRPGDYVEQGQPLFTVDTRSLRAQLAQANAAIGEARAAIAEAQSALSTANQQLALYRNVDDPAAVSRAEVIRAEGDASAARTRLGLARARLEAAQAGAALAATEIGRATVRAPMAGEILAVNIRPGEFLATQGGSGAPFIEMGQTRPLNIRIDIDEDQAPYLAVGAEAVVSPRGAAERQVKARFVRTEPLVIPKRSLTNSAAERVDVRVLQVIYELPAPAQGEDPLFRVGQQVDAFVPARKAGQQAVAK